MADPREIREQLVEAGARRVQLELTAAQAGAHVEQVLRDRGADRQAVATAERDRAAAEAAVAGQRAAEQRFRDRLGEAIAGALGQGPEADFARLDAAFPLVLLPVRIETRFRGAELLVRVYPDEIAAESHEPELTVEERDLGQAYWRAVWTLPGAEADEWRKILVSMPPQRAAWVVRRTEPTNLAVTPRPGEPAFPEVPLKTGAWTRAALTRALPDRWVALGFRGGAEVVRGVSGPVAEPLVLSLGPRPGEDAEVDVSGDGLTLDEAVAWTVDFAKAEAVGMAFRMPLSAADQAGGFDELLVLGVKGSLAPEAVDACLTDLLDAHHYERGLAFVRQGTPTNNTAAAPSGFPPADPDGAASFRVERGEPLARAGASGDLVARALGIAPGVFDHVDGAERDEQAGARGMGEALWPATWGYFLEQLLLGEGADLAAIDAFRRYFVDSVRGRGHHPAFRVGSTPYGVLVASSLARWQLRGRPSPLERALPEELGRLVPLWNQAVPGVPRAGRSGDPDADLVGILEMDASAREVRVRSVMGATMSYNLAAILGADWNGWSSERARLALEVAQLLGRTEIASRVFGLSYGKTAHAFARGLVVSTPVGSPEVLSETDPLDWNFIAWIRTASVDDLQAERLPDGVAKPTSLLYLMLRHAFLTHVKDTGDRLLLEASLIERAAHQDSELVGLSIAGPPGDTAARTSPAPTVWTRLAQAVPGVTGGLPLSRFLLETTAHPATQTIAEYRAGLAALEGLPTAELERLFTETLDLCSHRLDAWITSLFAERLSQIREAAPRGAHLGAYARVEGLRPAPASRRSPVPPERQRLLVQAAPALAKMALEQQVSTGGHIHAPSMTHAAAAAVLRSGYLSRHGAGDDRYAVNLSSARVRQAGWLLEAVRSGQALGAVLGYQVERGLHEGHRPLELDKYIETLRALFPLVATKLIAPNPGESAEAIAARNVVDGLALHTAWRGDQIPWATRGLPARPSADQAGIEAELRRLDESLDGLTDLLTAESVYQLVRGSTTAAAATLDSLARGVRPPDPEIAQTPRGGSTVHHRALLVLGGDAIAPAGWGAIGPTPRSRAEPFLDGWLGTLLGDPALVRCRVGYTDTADPALTREREVSLADLELRPLDVLAIATAGDAAGQTAPGAPTSSAQVSELDARVAWLVLGLPDAAPDAVITITYAPSDREALRSFPEIAEVTRAAAALLGPARAIEPRDLLAPDRLALLPEADLLPADAADRADAAAAELSDAVIALDAALLPLDLDPRPAAPDLTPLREALVAAARFGVVGAVPFRRAGNAPEEVEALIQRGRSVRDELRRRSDAAVAATAPAARAAAVFGEAFHLLPRFKPVATELDQALSVGPTPPPDAGAVRRWLHGAALVRPALERYKQLAMLARALGAIPPALRATQLPHRPGAPWVAEPFGDEGNRPPSGVVSLTLLGAAAPAASDTWVGLVLDEWTELIPNREESTAVAFHYDDPGSEAAQAILVAVPPDAVPAWSLDAVSAIVRETFELARLRAVSAEMVPALSQLLPAAYVAANPKRETVSTHLAAFVKSDFEIRSVP